MPNRHPGKTCASSFVDRGTHQQRCTRSPWLALPLLFGTALNALAQTGGTTTETAERHKQLEEVLVTASRRQESLQEVAASVTAIGGSQLEQNGITNFQDIKSLAAGLYLEKPRNIGDSSVRLRGVGSAPNSGIDSSVGVLVDGVYQIQPGAAFTELLDIERIEVLRGPQGTLFGRNTTAGVVHIHTNDPDTHEFSGKLQGVAGNYDSRELRGVINIPLVEDRLALRVSAFTGQRDGYTENTYLHEDTRDDDRHGGRVKLLWNATGDLEFLLSSETTTTKGNLDRGQIEYGRDNITNLPAYRGRPWQDLATDLGLTLPPISLGKAAENGGEYKDTVDRQVLTVNWAIPNHNLQSISAYEEIESYLLDDRDRTVMDLSSLTSEPTRRAWSEEIILSSEFSGPFSYVAGIFYQDEKLNSPTTIYNGPDYIALGGASTPPTVSTTTRSNQSRAIFGTVNYDLNDQWTVVGGLRYTSDKKQSYSTLAIPGRPLVVAVDDEETFDEWTYTAKLQYHFDPSKMAYLSIDRGFKSGSFNRQNTTCVLTGGAIGCLTPDQLTYQPETTDNFEIGLKSEWLDGSLRFNGALFYQIYDDYQVAQALPGEATVIISNAAKVESHGVELDVAAALTDTVTLEGGLAWITSEYDEFENAPCATPTQPGCALGVQDISGEQLDNAPTWSGNVALSYRAPIPFASNLLWFARADAVFKSDAYLDVSLVESSHQGGYTLYGARFGVEPIDTAWTLTFWGQNLGDKTYSSSGLVDVGGVTRYQGTPRTYGMTVDWNF